jgi:hypothetical protein
MQLAFWALVTIALIGGIFNARKSIVGFYIWLFTNMGLMVLNFMSGIPAQGILFIAYTCITGYGIYKWRRPKV